MPKGGYFSIEEFKTLTVNANAAGKFSYAAKTDGKISISFEAGRRQSAGRRLAPAGRAG